MSRGGTGKDVSKQEVEWEWTEQRRREWRKIREVTKSRADYILYGIRHSLRVAGEAIAGV